MAFCNAKFGGGFKKGVFLKKQERRKLKNPSFKKPVQRPKGAA